MTNRHPVLLTRMLPPRAMALLQSRVELTCNPHDRALTREELRAMIARQRGVITMLTDRIDAELLDVAPDLKVVANSRSGTTISTWRPRGRAGSRSPTPRAC